MMLNYKLKPFVCFVLLVPLMFSGCRKAANDVGVNNPPELASTEQADDPRETGGEAATDNVNAASTLAGTVGAVPASTVPANDGSANTVARDTVSVVQETTAVQRTQQGTASGRNAGTGSETLSLSGIKSGRGVFVGELNPVNYKSLDPAVLLQMGMEQYQVSFILGERYLNTKYYDRALAEYNKAIAGKPDYAEALFSRGRTYHIKGDLNKALDDYGKVINLKKNSAAAYNYRGYILAQRGDYAKAMADYNQALALKRDYGDALYNRGYAYRIQGQYDKAIDDFTRLIQLEPNNASAFNQRGTAWYYKKNDDRAIQDFSEAIRLKPDYALAWHNRGTAQRMTGNISQASADFAEASRLGYR
jgi:Flp pilus assembly protein TadD